MPVHSSRSHAEGSEFPRAREYFRNLVYQEILAAFSLSSMSRAELSRRLKRKPEQITRWLSAPGNLEIDTLSDLLMAMNVDPKSIIRGRPPSIQSVAVKELLRKLGNEKSENKPSLESKEIETPFKKAVLKLNDGNRTGSLFQIENRINYLRPVVRAEMPANKPGRLASMLAKKQMEAV